MDDTNTNPLVETTEEKAFFDEAQAAETQPQPAPYSTSEPTPQTVQQQASRQVPLAALQEERQKRRAEEERSRGLTERMESLTKNFDTLISRLSPPNPEDDPIPTLEDNPISHFDARMKRYEKVISELLLKENNRDQEGRQIAALQQLQTAYVNDAATFRAKIPDFMDAYNHVMTMRSRQLLAGGFSAQEVQAIMVREEKEIVERAMMAGQSPSERMYQLAKEFGYMPKSAQSSNLSAQNNAQRSLSAIPGTETGELSLEKLTLMSDDEFDKNWDKVMRGTRR